MSTPRGGLEARARSSLLAGALGDAWGRAHEGATGPLTPTFPEHPRLSDDTLPTAATCEAIVSANGVVSAATIATTMSQWFVAGRLRGLGSSTLKALRDLSAGAHWASAGARG